MSNALWSWQLRLLFFPCVIFLVLASCSGSTTGQSGVSPRPSASTQSGGPGIAIPLKATATVSFESSGFKRDYRLDSGSNPRNSLALESHQAFVDLGSPDSQEFNLTVVGGGAPGVTLKGPGQVLAAFSDESAHVGGIATVGQGVCTLMLTRFGNDGMAGSLDCENVAATMGAAGPVSFSAVIDAVPA